MPKFISPLFVVNTALTITVIVLSFLNFKKSKNKIFLYIFIYFILSGSAYLFDYLNWGNLFSLLSIMFKVISYLIIIQFLHSQLVLLNNNGNNNNNNNLPK